MKSMPDGYTELVIEGITLDGETFRPSDWIERLMETLLSYGNDRRRQPRPYNGPERRCRQIEFLQAAMCDGQKCLIVDMRLEQANPDAFRFLMEFVASNHLRYQARSGN